MTDLKTRPTSVAELFKTAAAMNPRDAVDYLRRNKHPAISQLIRLALSDVVWNVEPCCYSPATIEQSVSLLDEVNRLYLWTNDPDRSSAVQHQPRKSQRLFEGLLNSLIAEEAELLLSIIRHETPCNIEKSVLLEAYDDITSPDPEHRRHARSYSEATAQVCRELQSEIRQLDTDIAHQQTVLQRLCDERNNKSRILVAKQPTMALLAG